MKAVEENYKRILNNVKECAVKAGRSDEDVRLMCVTKTVEPPYINRALELGADLIGENRVQEYLGKRDELNLNGVEKHLIGHLQTNKVKYIAPFVALIHSVDSLKLAQTIDKEAAKAGRTIDVLLQLHIAQEETKFGFTPDECRELVNHLPELPHVQICGIMGMATLTDDESQIRKEFHTLHALFTELKETVFCQSEAFSILSMGMSHDYKLAIEEGSNMIRVGTYIFGEREY